MPRLNQVPNQIRYGAVIEIGEKDLLVSLKDSYRPKDRSLSTLVDNIVVEKAISRSRTYKFFKL